MKFLYNNGVSCYSLAITIASLYSQKARLRHSGGRRALSALRLACEKWDSNDEIIWVHAASLGEFEQGRPLIERLRKEKPNSKIVLTFFSPSGYEIRKNYDGADFVGYMPMDSQKNAREFIATMNPKMAIFIKYEFWVNHLLELKKRDIPCYIVSAIFRENQAFFNPKVSFFRDMLSCFTHFYVQDDNSKRLLATIGVNNVTVAGDTRFDRVANITEKAKKLDFIEKFKGNKPFIVAGSTWGKDEDLLCKYINENNSKAKMIIVPHEVEENRIEEITKKLNCSYVRWTKLDDSIPEQRDAKCLIIDTIGLLSSVYQYGRIAYIGGGFGVGIHNTLEAAAWGMPVVWGTNYHKFQEAKDLIACGAGFSISNYNQLEQCFKKLLNNSNTERQASLDYVRSKCGATETIIKDILA